MTLFPKSQRFPTQKGSEVPSPGRYNPSLHDPSQDPWRKGALEIYKAARNKQVDPGPARGLDPSIIYHGDTLEAKQGTPEIRDQTVGARIQYHTLTETLQKTEQTTKEIRNALNKSEHDNSSLRSEVDRLKKQLHGLAGLHAKVIELESEHDKSKKRREKEISTLKTELRLAEDRASQYLNDKNNLQGDFERLQTSLENSECALQSTSRKTNQQLSRYLEKSSKSASTLVQQASVREDLLYEVFDSLLETNDMQMQQLIDIEVDLQLERDELRQSLVQLREESQSRQELSDQQVTESIQESESQLVEMNEQIDCLHENHSLAAKAWQLKQSELQSNIKKLEKDLREEKAKRNKLSGELMLTKQAEAALQGEVEHAQNLNTQLEEVERENEQLKKINDLIMRQSNLNAAEAAKVEKLNNELVSQRNPAQKVKILDRMRKEIKEERENTAKLENQLWTANTEIKTLKEELSAYHKIEGEEEEAAVIRPNPKIPTRTKASKHHQPSHFLTPHEFIQETLMEDQEDHPKSSRLPTTNNNNLPKLVKKRDDSKKEKLMIINKNNNLTNNVGEISLGAIKMQGKMTLDELR
ncbi:hypothetical protein PSTT_00404 [Puccinia striiformis]|uniref:Hyaluronan-mediated motility receptor C-terminal domain-containing protein n=1 Tax=Puccinia striiformis TaxID=27350 RepID=A0A2S4W7J3_9BASI|nr:hypothetical protein PSTT_00404 [Puccinia striiformis]